MRLQHQTTFGGVDDPPEQVGNCYATCLASLLDLDVANVPNFCAIKDNSWFSQSQQWLAERGLMSMNFRFNPFEDPAYHHGISIAAGPGPRGHQHAVLWQGTKLFHDPHPSGAGLLKATEWEVLVVADLSMLLRKWGQS